MSRRTSTAKKPAPTPTTRCAIYTRKSSDEGLQQEFNSLDAQREAAEAYIASQKAEGWVCLPDRYDDGGFTGGNMERPALRRLLADIEAGKIDCIVVYRVDRLSRSLMDFARIVETFDRHAVSFVSVTQHFNTTNSMGRLTLNILLSFAQFEREIIGERIRDKIAASRQRGKWTGGTPILGYDVDRSNAGPRLVINPAEASRVCRIFELYLERGALLPVVAELERRGWRNKTWTTRAGGRRGGLPFDKCRLHALLTNVLYAGKLRHKDQIYAGEHEPIISEDLFNRVQQQLRRNGRAGTAAFRNRHGALLRGLLFCKACNRAMSHTFTTRGNRRYRYYTCTNATKRGRKACPSGSLPAVEIENVVVVEVRCIGRDQAVIADTLREATKQVDAEIERLTAERRAVERGLARLHAEVRRLTSDGDPTEQSGALEAANEQAGIAERRLTEIDCRIAELRAERLDATDVATALADFDNVWAALSPREQARVIHLLVERIEFDAEEEAIEVAFHATGITTLPETIRGVIHKTYHRSPSFSAGLLKSADGRSVRFAGKLCANEGDVVALVGRWKHDARYGRQFTVESLSYELPETSEGLVHYLAKHPAFTGIGEATARRIVAYTAGAANLDRIIRQDVDELHRELRIPRAALESLREAWIGNSAENEVRTYLAGFGLTPHQMDTLLEQFGNAIVGVLRGDPYQLIRHIRGYGFKKVDKIARAMGTPKDHPGRIEAGLTHVVNEETGNGHTWVGGRDLVEKANELLLLDTLDSRDVIRAAGERLLQHGDLVADGAAVTTPYFLESERLIREALRTHAWDELPRLGVEGDSDGLKARQIDALHIGLRYAIAVISGGAGTGKTYMLARLTRAFRDAGLTIALCSPTGKAAKRIEETLRAQGIALEAKTIHRLLKYDGTRFNRESLSEPVEPDPDRDDDEGEPAYDAVIVDEVSMVDVPLMAELLRRIDLTRTRLILVGDHNQLPPVGPGNVLRDIISHRLAPLVVLDEVVRQAGVLKANSSAVLAGVLMPTAAGDPAWTVIDSFRDPLPIQAYLRELVLQKLPERLGLDPIRDIQIITPTHLGALGTRALNQMMQHLLHGDPGRKFAVGDKVIQTANDYGLGVMNGTIGRVIGFEPGREGGYWIEFDGAGQRRLKDEQLANVQLAYVLTAHKAQGSEFHCVVVLCHRSHFFADRNWLYTAVTRAAKYCVLIGDQWGLRSAVRKNHVIHRRTFLDRWARRTADGVHNGQELVHA